MTDTCHLYDLFKPNHYDLYFNINRSLKTIRGKTTICGQALAPTIRLNQKFLQFSSVTVNGQAIPFESSDEKEELILPSLPTGDITLTITYETKLTDPMMGIYPCYYQVAGEKNQLVATQFETTFARQAFPCIDEPAAKATFSLAIQFDEKEGERVLSNQLEERYENGIHYFKPTLRMSTYLLAFVFGDLQSKTTHTQSGIEVGVFATKAHRAKDLDFALDIAKRSIEFFEDFYQTPYPLKHSYQVALPDFSAGAMENWGLVTYREAYLLVDPENTSLSTKQVVANVIAHELAHQWFGDLVTMKWWDDLWLNESFANMMEYVAIDALQPDYKIWESFQTSEAPAALGRDATAGVQSVHVMVNDPREIDAIFDSAIVYAKGARLLVMVRSLVGDQVLRKGLKAYFKSHQYSNAAGKDLWQALGEASHLNIGEIMENWLDCPGYPVLSVSLDHDKLLLNQEQFFIGKKEDSQTLWHIPLNSNYDEVPQLMEGKSLTLPNYQAMRQANGKAFRLNHSNSAHYIVNYSPELLEDILNELDLLDPITQLQILQDLDLLAKGGYRSYADLLPVMKRLAASPSSIVQSKIYDLTQTLKDFVSPNSEQEAQLKALVYQLAHPALQVLGSLPQPEDINDASLARPYVLAQALYAEDTETIKALHAFFQSHKEQHAHLPAAIRGLILQNEVKHFADKDFLKDLLDTYQTSSNASYKADLRQAITHTKDSEMLDHILSLFKDSQVIKPQDLRSWYRGVLTNPLGEQKAWEWLQEEWAWLEETVGGDMEFATFITVTAHCLHTSKRLEEFKNFFLPKKDTPGLGREILMDIRLIEAKVAFIEANQESLLSALSSMKSI